MKVFIQNNSMIPVYEQIASQIKRSILDGDLHEGDLLPSVRSLAKELKISALTVKKAYDFLDNEGFINTVHGKGSYVLAINSEAKKEDLLYQIEMELDALVKKAHISGISNDEINELLQIVIEQNI